MSDVAIELRGIDKVFRLYPDLVRSRLKQALFFWKRYYTEKHALSGVDLTIRRGEIVGVIGPNGAGKTTLLKIIAGISFPTRGSVRVDGRVVAVLALGLGFHPRLTGSQNIELAGMMLGMSRAEVRRQRDWIIDFSELGEYIGQPLTSYSSGMRARLSFAVAACQEPEILIIDEALATGDVRFVQKCINRIQEITRSGTTALFVSHNIWSIKRLTNRCILIDGGRVVDDGETGRVADRYYEALLRSEVLETPSESTSLAEFVGDGQVRLRRLDLRDSNGRSTRTLNSGEPATLLLEVDAAIAVATASISLTCTRSDGVVATTMGAIAGGVLDTHMRFGNPAFSLPQGVSVLRIEMAAVLLAPGEYSLDLHIFDAEGHSGFTSNTQFYFKPRVIEFGVRRLGNPNRSIVYYQPATTSLGEWESGDAS